MRPWYMYPPRSKTTVLMPFALLRLSWPHMSNLGRDLANQFLIGRTDSEGIGLHGEGDDARGRYQDGVREADLEYQVAGRHRGAVADAVDFQTSSETVGNP